MATEKRLSKGTEVKWSSQVRGNWYEKTGTILRFLNGGDDARDHIGAKTMVSQLWTRTPESIHERYLVKSVEEDGKVRYYTPRASVIEAAMEEAAVKAEKKAAREAKKAVATKKTPAAGGSKKAKVKVEKAAKPKAKSTAVAVDPAALALDDDTLAV